MFWFALFALAAAIALGCALAALMMQPARQG